MTAIPCGAAPAHTQRSDLIACVDCIGSSTIIRLSVVCQLLGSIQVSPATELTKLALCVPTSRGDGRDTE